MFFFADHLSLPPVKIHCSLLAEDAIRIAVKDYQDKWLATKHTGEEELEVKTQSGCM